MKINILLTVILSTFFIQNCVSISIAPNKIKLTAVASWKQKTDPYGAIVSENRHMVSISHYQEIQFIKDKTMFKLIIENGGEKPVKISNENISVIFERRSGDSSPDKFHIQSQSEFLKDLEKDYHNEENRRINNILRETGYTIHKIEAGIGPGDFNIKFDLDIYDLELQEMQFEQLEDIAPKLIFKEQTIMPHTSILAIVSCDTKEIAPDTEGNFKVVVSVDGEDHEFIFSRNYIQKLKPTSLNGRVKYNGNSKGTCCKNLRIRTSQDQYCFCNHC